MNVPRPPLPEPLRGADGSFTHYTISVRLPNIARRVLTEHSWPAEIADNLQALIEELPHGILRPIQDPGTPDETDWRHFLLPYSGQTWLEIPWFFVEMYFFRRILEATGYFQPGPGRGIDPYAFQKRQGLLQAANGLAPMLAMLDALPLETPAEREIYQEPLAHMLTLSMWANQADLSMWPAGSNTQPGRPSVGHQDPRLLVDDASSAAQYLVNLQQPARVGIILDNGGLELAYDLGLADFLLRSRLAGVVELHTRVYPTYVSDVTLSDVMEMVAFFEQTATLSVSGLSGRLRDHLARGSLRFREHSFWVSPLAGWEMPPGLSQELGTLDLLVSKGDANYRRWLGDRHWSYTIPAPDVLCYLPAPWLALRVLKSETALGLRPGLPEGMDRKDPQWLYDGKWGMIQFVT